MDRPPAEPPPGCRCHARWSTRPPSASSPLDARERPVRAIGLPESAVRAGWGGGARDVGARQGGGATGACAGRSRRVREEPAARRASEYRRTPDGRPRAGWADPVGPPPTPTWRRLVRTRRGAVGLAIVAAALLLWPFAGPCWIPWLVGFLALILLRLLRLDGLLRGWDVHAGRAGRRRRDDDQHHPVGVGAGREHRRAHRRADPAAGVATGRRRVRCCACWPGPVTPGRPSKRSGRPSRPTRRCRSAAGRSRALRAPNGVLPILLNRIAQGSPDAICDNLLVEPVRAQFAEAAGQPDCDAAVHALAAQVTDPAGTPTPRRPASPSTTG